MVLIFIFILGLAVGSFINVLIDRLPKEKSINGRSQCDFCKKTLHPKDLVPVFSYIFLRGKCRYCRKTLSIQYPAIELLTGVMFILTWTLFQNRGIFDQIYTLALVAIFIAMFFSDLKYQVLPDEEQFALSLLAIGTMIFSGSAPNQIIERIVFSFVAMIPLLILFLATKGKGMGFGDVKLLFVLGLIFGLQGALITLYMAFISGGIYGAATIILKKHKMKSKIAFGPFIILSAIMYLFFTQNLNSIFNTIFNF